MDIIKFNNPVAPTKMEQGEVVNGLTTKMWIERYDKAGEFTLKAPADSGIKELLPLGTFISHINTTELMIVENHEISDNEGSESEIIVTGRSFETFLENRIVGSNKTFPVSGTMTDYVLASNYTWNQAVTLVNDHTLLGSLINPNDAIPYLSVTSAVYTTGILFDRTIGRGNLYELLLILLSIENLGIKIIRPGIWSPFGPVVPNFIMLIHKGVDRSSTVIFSYDTGEIVSADYLWSNKNLKNAALITGKWVETVVTTPNVEYNKRMMYVTASDIDDAQTVAPTGGALTLINAAMQQRGLEALAAQKGVALTKAEVSKQAVEHIFRTDYDVGDLVTVSGKYSEISVMRVTEYVEIEDNTGENGYPTLALD